MAKEGLKGKPVPTRLDRPTRDALRRLAKKRNLYVSDLIREAVKTYVSQASAA